MDVLIRPGSSEILRPVSQPHVETIERALAAAPSNPEALFGIVHEDDATKADAQKAAGV